MNHNKLDVWKKSIQLVKEIYRITEKLPDTEKYGLRSQIQRSVISVPSNIAEGSARESDKELIHFLYVSLGSMAELETQLIIAEELNFLHFSSELERNVNSIKQMLLGLIKYLKKKNRLKV